MAFDGHTAQSPIARLRLASYTGRVEWLAGRPRNARRWYAEAIGIARTHRITRMLSFYVSGAVACTALTGDLEAADSLIQDLERYGTCGFLASEENLGTAWLHAARGELTRARHPARRSRRRPPHRSRHLRECLLLTDIARLGDPGSVQQRLTELASRCDGALTHARARFATALADDDPDRLTDCSHDLERMGSPILAAESAAAAASAWKHYGDARKATAATTRATTLAAECEGARTPLLSTLASTSGPLTKRQQEIALMAAAGNTTKAISQHLTLSVRTVENHLQHIYVKFGVRNRTDLAEALKYQMGRKPNGH
ncbi:response regulator transcription factor [Streptomyces sp. NPDC060002]|uniref:helix-turn-helix transcriptional regulator n=1 Tax=Streptomyces sp. NPDC060002 TaxID=3347033 RepID=UPI00367A6E82